MPTVMKKTPTLIHREPLEQLPVGSEIFIMCLLRSQGSCLLMQNGTFAGPAGSIVSVRVLTH